MHDLSRAGPGIEQCRSWGLAFAGLDGLALCKIVHGRDGIIQRVDLGHHTAEQHQVAVSRMTLRRLPYDLSRDTTAVSVERCTYLCETDYLLCSPSERATSSCLHRHAGGIW